MTAETLRRAAALMRERAEAANDGPWTTTKAFNEFDDYGYGGEVRSPTLGHGGDQDDLIASAVDRADAEHIASWHPAVALAVADWLTNLAQCEEDNTRDLGFSPIDCADALAVAAAYLGAEVER